MSPWVHTSVGVSACEGARPGGARGLGIGPPCVTSATRGQQRGAVLLREPESGPPGACASGRESGREARRPSGVTRGQQRSLGSDPGPAVYSRTRALLCARGATRRWLDLFQRGNARRGPERGFPPHTAAVLGLSFQAWGAPDPTPPGCRWRAGPWPTSHNEFEAETGLARPAEAEACPARSAHRQSQRPPRAGILLHLQLGPPSGWG